VSDDLRWVRARALHERIATIGSNPTDNSAARIQNRALTLSSILTAGVISLWLPAYFLLGLAQQAMIPISYIVMTALGAVHFARTHRPAFFRTSQLIMYVSLPFLLQLALGGFVNASAIIVFSLAGAILGMSITGVDRGKWWFAPFVALVLLAALLDSRVSANPPFIPGWAITAFFALNVIGATAIAFITLGIYARARDVLAAELAVEKERSERLLLNVLPPSIADRLKDGESPIADHHDGVAVLMADIVGFTSLSAGLEPDDLVVTLNKIFGAFDAVTAEFGLEKIKTIGDAYMVVAGAPLSMAEGPERIADAALAMRDIAGTHSIDGEHAVQMRFGIDVGPAVAGVIGTSKFTYDLYGDTVNTASRMESTGRPDEIQVTTRAMERLSATHTFGDKLTSNIKGLGLTDTYFLTGRK
jgi:guanylate cyclase